MTAELPPPRLGAFVAGSPALILSTYLARRDFTAYVDALARNGLHPSRLVALQRCVASIHAAGSLASSSEGALTQTVPESELIDTSTAAALLGVSRARVCQLLRCGALDGELRGRTWLVSKQSVVERQAAA